MEGIIAIIVLGIVCIGQAVERHFYAKDMTQKLNDSIKAVMSRNINEYIAAVNTDKKPTKAPQGTDEVLLSDADDAVFDKFIQNQTQ